MTKKWAKRGKCQTGKIWFPDEETALAGIINKAMNFRAYECPFCKGYHLSSQEYKPKKTKKMKHLQEFSKFIL